MLTAHLRSKGYTVEELIDCGLAKQSSKGTPIDRFHRRLIWPIRDTAGDVVGFGARKLFDDDPGPKYLNTAETLLFHKSNVCTALTWPARPSPSAIKPSWSRATPT